VRCFDVRSRLVSFSNDTTVNLARQFYRCVTRHHGTLVGRRLINRLSADKAGEGRTDDIHADATQANAWHETSPALQAGLQTSAKTGFPLVRATTAYRLEL